MAFTKMFYQFGKPVQISGFSFGNQRAMVTEKDDYYLRVQDSLGVLMELIGWL